MPANIDGQNYNDGQKLTSANCVPVTVLSSFSSFKPCSSSTISYHYCSYLHRESNRDWVPCPDSQSKKRAGLGVQTQAVWLQSMQVAP